MAKCVSLILCLIIHVSSRNELSENFNTWTEISGVWSYNDGTDWVQLKQSLSSSTHAEISILDTQWHNDNGPLSINYTYAIDFKDTYRSSGILLQNGKAGSSCEYYYFGIESWNDKYYALITRTNANVEEVVLVEDLLTFTYIEDNEYTLSIIIDNHNTFNIWINSMHISYTDNDGYTTLDNGYSGYIGIWSQRKIQANATYLEISGTPMNLSPTGSTSATSQDPIATKAPTQSPTVASLTPTSSTLSFIDTTISMYHDANAIVSWIVSGNVLILWLMGAGLLLVCLLIFIICIKCRRKDGKETHDTDHHKEIQITDAMNPRQKKKSDPKHGLNKTEEKTIDDESNTFSLCEEVNEKKVTNAAEDVTVAAMIDDKIFAGLIATNKGGCVVVQKEGEKDETIIENH